MSDPGENQRKLRADAQHNRNRILEVAKEAFARAGADASLDDIAKQSGVGSGTLYRHFPTRQALIEAVYFRDVEKLGNLGAELADSEAPMDALRAWMLTFVDHVIEKRILASALNEAAYAQAGVTIQATIRRLVLGAIESGDLREDTNPFDLLRAMLGVLQMGQDPSAQESARRLVDLLLRGAGRRG